jgi:hypothetical protein
MQNPSLDIAICMLFMEKAQGKKRENLNQTNSLFTKCKEAETNPL